MFTMGYNASNTGQTFYDRRGNPLALAPHYAADLALFAQPPAQLRPVKNFLRDIVAEQRAFDVQRTFCLGDVLMLVPVVRELERLGYDIHYQTDDRFVPLLHALEIKTAYCNRLVPTIMLDWVVERDHSDKALQKLHRTETFARAVGLTKMPERWNWDCALSKFPEMKDSWAEQKFVVFQGGGAARQRGLSAEAVRWVLQALAIEGVRTLYIGEPLPDLGPFPDDTVRLQFMNGTLRELFSWIARATCLITMDSAPLWISHFTKTPVIALLGPSCAEQRLKLHPLWPDGVTAIELNKEFDCDPCFEIATKCNNTYKCLHDIDGEQLYELVRPHVMQYWEVPNDVDL